MRNERTFYHNKRLCDSRVDFKFTQRLFRHILSSTRASERTGATDCPALHLSEGRNQWEVNSGLLNFLRSCRKRNLPVGVTVYKINTEKICTYDLDDILIFYYDFHSFLQSDAGVETNLLIMSKVFIIFSHRDFF